MGFVACSSSLSSLRACSRPIGLSRHDSNHRVEQPGWRIIVAFAVGSDVS
jgi:hypothetical protein